MPEIWDLYDINHQLLGKTHERGVPITARGEYHLVVEIITSNSAGELLITRRHGSKQGFPLMWEFTGGAVTAGEDSLTAAVRELYEETGIAAEKNELTFLGTLIGGTALHDHYALTRDISLSELRLQVDEVIDARWATESEIEKMISGGEFIPHVYERYLRLHRTKHAQSL